MSSWATRIPQVRDGLGLTPSRLGLVLLAIAAGSIVSLVLAGQIVARFGSRRTVTAMAALLGVSLIAVAVGFQFGVVPVVVGLFFFGFANGAWDVAMNVQGAVVERRLGRAIMPRFHAGYSVGTVAGALVGAVAIALDVPVTAHLIVAGAGRRGDRHPGGPVLRAGHLGGRDEPAAESERRDGGDRLAPHARHLAGAAHPAGRRLRAGLRVRRGHRHRLDQRRGDRRLRRAGDGRHPGVRPLPGRDDRRPVVRAGLLDKYGRVPVLRVLAVVSLVGLRLFVFGGNILVAFVGALFWGLGASLGFPVGMSAAADEPARAAARVSVVASIGYCAFLGGPPLVGFLGDHITVQTGTDRGRGAAGCGTGGGQRHPAVAAGADAESRAVPRTASRRETRERHPVAAGGQCLLPGLNPPGRLAQSTMAMQADPPPAARCQRADRDSDLRRPRPFHSACGLLSSIARRRARLTWLNTRASVEA